MSPTTAIRSTTALALASAFLLPAAAGAQSAAPSSSKSRAQDAAARTVKGLAPVGAGTEIVVLRSTSRCKPQGRRRGQRLFTCRITHTVDDASGGVALGSERRRCTVRKAVVAVSSRGARVTRLGRFRCRPLERQAPGHDTPATPAAPDTPSMPDMPSAPPAGPGEGPGGSAPGTPPGAVPPGPPPAAVASSSDRSFKSTRPAGTWSGWSGWYQIEGGWWINNAWWSLGSSAPPGAHPIGWEHYWYFESYYWGYDRDGRLGMQFWYSGRYTN